MAKLHYQILSVDETKLSHDKRGRVKIKYDYKKKTKYHKQKSVFSYVLILLSMTNLW